MPFGQSALMTSITLGLVRRVTFTASRALGASVEEAAELSDDIGLTAAATVGTAASIITVDPVGFGLSQTLLALEASESDRRNKRGH